MRMYLDDSGILPEGFDVLVRNVETAKEIMEYVYVDHISFDYNLNSPSTGLALAVWIKEMASSYEMNRMTWAIHSGSKVERGLITREMLKAERCWSSYD